MRSKIEEGKKCLTTKSSYEILNRSSLDEHEKYENKNVREKFLNSFMA